MLVKCFTCGNEFTKRPSEVKKSVSGNHYCSRSCAAKVNNLGKQRNPPKQRYCARCSTPYKNSRKVSSMCQPCRLETTYQLKTIGEYRNALSVKNKHSSWLSAHIRNFNRSWNKHLTLLPCKNCNYDKHVELCHIRAITSFPDSTLLGEVNAPSNIIQLCRNCHWEFDNGLLKL